MNYELSQCDFIAPAQLLWNEDIKCEWQHDTYPIGIGLDNLGGTSCFMNATLQCLCYTAMLQNYMSLKHHPAECMYMY
eukprot:UN03217